MNKGVAAILLPFFLGPWMEASDLVESRIAPDIAIVTEISVASPFVGQQVGIVYRLRALRPPSAVDVDPQQFTGFWMESVPLSDSGRGGSRSGGFEEYLLRSVVLFPLYAGDVEIPRLRVKVKRSETGGEPGAWDLVGVSRPLTLRVRETAPGAHGQRPLVGRVSGRMFEEVRGGAPAVFLELTGTANLALFDPSVWMELPGVPSLPVRQVDYQSDIEPTSMKPGGVPAIRMRRRWEVRAPGGLGVPDLQLPVFDAAAQKLQVVRIASPGAPPVPFPGRAAAREGGTAGRWGWRTALGGLAVLGSLLCWMLVWVRRSNRVRARVAVPALRKLLEDGEKMQRAPRPYFETAQRVVQHCAREFRDNRTVQARAAECRSVMERWRFSPAGPPAGSRHEIDGLLRALLKECEYPAQAQAAPRASSQARSRMLL